MSVWHTGEPSDKRRLSYQISDYLNVGKSLYNAHVLLLYIMYRILVLMVPFNKRLTSFKSLMVKNHTLVHQSGHEGHLVV